MRERILRQETAGEKAINDLASNLRPSISPVYCDPSPRTSCRIFCRCGSTSLVIESGTSDFLAKYNFPRCTRCPIDEPFQHRTLSRFSIQPFVLGFDVCLRSGRSRSFRRNSGSVAGIRSPSASARPSDPSARAKWRNSAVRRPARSSGRWARKSRRLQPHTPATNSGAIAPPSGEPRISPTPRLSHSFNLTKLKENEP